MNWYSKYFILLLTVAVISSCKSRQTVWQEPSVVLLPIDGQLNMVDSAAFYMILPYKRTLDSQMNRVVGHCDQAMQKQRPEGVLGNWAADAVQWNSTTTYHNKWQITVLNHGGLRTDLPAGEITLGKIYEIMPFDNELVLLGLTKKETIGLAETIIAKQGDPVAGIHISKTCEGKINILINDMPLDSIAENDTIWLATSDYMANGGDDYSVLSPVKNREITGMLIRNAMLNYLQYNREIKAKIEGRIQLCP